MRSIQKASKRAINLPLNGKVLDMARDMGLHISQTVDTLLTEEVLRQYWQRWNADNADAIAHFNARIVSEGLFSDRYRSFMRTGDAQDAEADAA